MQPQARLSVALFAAVLTAVSALSADLKSAVESPDAQAIIAKDLLGPAKTYKLPQGCITTDAERVANGKLFFHNLNSEQAKVKTADGKLKQFGNCVACHKIEGSKGHGNVGPDLTNYSELFVKSGARSPDWVFQKVADARIDNAKTNMTVNLTSGLMNEREVCDITSYILSKK
ncbi:MAG: sulfur oxidation c-type cytochrome SoxX [Campylobacterales bacterium]